jgi:hypothetical protein
MAAHNFSLEEGKPLLQPSPGKKVALNTLILSNVEAPSARLLNCNIFLATLQYSDVF